MEILITRGEAYVIFFQAIFIKKIQGLLMTELIVGSGRIFELVQTTQPDGRVFEVARRAPGVRVIIADKSNRQLLLSREFRHELGEWDYRLPGGKVFDSLDEFAAFRGSGGDIAEPAAAKAKAEASEEAGVDVTDVRLYATSTLGATVEWDLYVYEATDWVLDDRGQQLEDSEVGHIDEPVWCTYDDVRAKIMNGEMHEDRIAMILLRWLEEHGD